MRRHKRGHIKPVTHWFAATVNCPFATHPAAVTIKNGATPTKAATSRRLSCPNSGICASNKAAVRKPTPLIEVSFSALADRRGDCSMCSLIRRSSFSICFLIWLIKLRFNFTTEASLTRAPRFCSITSRRVKCRRWLSDSRRRSCSTVAGGDCLRLHHFAKLAQDFRVDAIGLSQDSRRARKLAHPVGLDQTSLNSRPRKRLD